MTNIKSSIAFKDLTIVTVFKSGPYWWPEYVYRLRDAVARNLTVPHRFVCLSDIELECDTVPLITMPNIDNKTFGVWWKMQLWRPENNLTGRTLFVDIDTLIVDDFVDVIQACRGHPFLMSHDPWKGPAVACSALMYWEGDHSDLWHTWCDDTKHIIQTYQTAQDRKLRGAQQAFVADHKMHDYIQNVLDSSERIDRIRNQPHRGYAAFLFCSGRRKPWLNPHHPDVQQHWFGHFMEHAPC